MNERPTPETDAAVQASNGQWSFVLRDVCKRLERERDEAIAARTPKRYSSVRDLVKATAADDGQIREFDRRIEEARNE